MIPSLSIATGSTLAVAFGAAYADVSGLSVFLPAGATFRFRGFLNWSASATTVGLCTALGGTATITLLTARVGTQTNSSGAATTQVHSGLQPATNAPGLAAQTSTTYGVVIDGLIVVNNAGTLTVSAKGQGTAGTATIAAGGKLLVEQIA